MNLDQLRGSMRATMIISLFLIFIVISSLSWAEEKSGGDLRSAVQNPISALISLPFKFNFDYGAPDGEASFLNKAND